MLLQPLEEGFVGKHLVQNLSSIIHKDEFDTLFDAWWDVFVDVRLACCRDDELCRNKVRKVRRQTRDRSCFSLSLLFIPAR